MKQTIIAISILITILATIFSNEYFEDKIMGQNKKVLGVSKEDKFFLPFPKDSQVISSNSDQRNVNIIIKTNKKGVEVRDFYKEILRSKNYENDYEYEKDNIIEIRYLNETEDLKITIAEENDSTIVEFNHHN